MVTGEDVASGGPHERTCGWQVLCVHQGIDLCGELQATRSGSQADVARSRSERDEEKEPMLAAAQGGGGGGAVQPNLQADVINSGVVKFADNIAPRTQGKMATLDARRALKTLKWLRNAPQERLRI